MICGVKGERLIRWNFQSSHSNIASVAVNALWALWDFTINIMFDTSAKERQRNSSICNHGEHEMNSSIQAMAQSLSSHRISRGMQRSDNRCTIQRLEWSKHSRHSESESRHYARHHKTRDLLWETQRFKTSAVISHIIVLPQISSVEEKVSFFKVNWRFEEWRFTDFHVAQKW